MNFQYYDECNNVSFIYFLTYTLQHRYFQKIRETVAECILKKSTQHGGITLCFFKATFTKLVNQLRGLLIS